MAKPIKRVSLQSEIIRYIQSYIEEHDLKEGDRQTPFPGSVYRNDAGKQDGSSRGS